MSDLAPPPPPPSPAGPPAVPVEFHKSGFWRRVAALLIDSIILGVVGWTLGSVFADNFIRMAGWERAIGFAVACLYFVPLNSRLGGGRTLGKRALGIRVVGKEGGLLGIGRSFLRSSVLMLPHFINGVPIPYRILSNPVVAVLFGEALFGLGLSIVYLIVFNTRTRQSVHDLVVGSYVVRVESETAEKPSTWKGHYVVVAIILLLTAAAPLVLAPLAKKWLPEDLMTAYASVEAQPEVAWAQLFTGQTFSWSAGGQRTSTAVTMNVRVNRRLTDRDEEANKLVKIVLEKFPAAATKDSIAVTVAEGYDLGIASWFFRQTYNYSPAQWRERIEQRSANTSP